MKSSDDEDHEQLSKNEKPKVTPKVKIDTGSNANKKVNSVKSPTPTTVNSPAPSASGK